MSERLALVAALWLVAWAPAAAQAQARSTAHVMAGSAAPPAGQPASAPPLDLVVRALPLTSLHMRGPRVAQAGGSAVRSATSGVPSAGQDGQAGAEAPAAGPEAPPLARLRRQLLQKAAALPDRLRTLAEMLVVRLSLGLGVDGGQPSHDPRLDGSLLTADTYESLRFYYIGDAVLGSRGFIAPGITTYVAAGFRLDQSMPPDRTSSPVPSVYDPAGAQPWQDHVMVRSAYGQTDGFFGIRRLAPLYVRAGRQYRYRPTIVHFDGVTIGYAGQALAMAAFAGVGADPYGYVSAPGERPYTYRYQGWSPSSGAGLGIAGLEARVDLHVLRDLPLVLDLSSLAAGEHTHTQIGAALRWGTDILMGGALRWLDGHIARQRFDLHARLSKVTTVVAAVDRRTEHDWMYDLFTFERQQRSGSGAFAAGPQYLELHVPQRRTYFDLRAGTVLLDNVDVLVRAAAAVSNDEPTSDSAYALEYVEAGSGFEIRLRRTWSVSASVLGRSYSRADAEPLVERCTAAELGCTDPLPPLAVAGSTSFVEGSITSHLTLGARSFSADIEVYGRDYDLVQVYEVLGEEQLDRFDRRGGVRFAAEGWPSTRLRLRAEYDLSFFLPTMPELSGIKSLRVVVEGQF